MKHTTDVPSLGDLALQYGTINKKQLAHLLEMQGKTGLSFAQLMKQENVATKYQISLIMLIREFLILRQQGEEFGKIAVEKGYATRENVDKALEKQLQEFRSAKLKRMIGEILVESRVITPEQREIITQQQKLLELGHHTPENEEPSFSQGNQPMGDLELQSNTSGGEDSLGQKGLNLSPEELRFLKVRNMDKIFASNVVKTGFATKENVDTALDTQKIEFKRRGSIRLLGDIMVEEGFLSKEQRDLILAAQNRMEEISFEEVPDTGIKIILSDDAMEAWVEAPKAQKRPISLPLVKTALNTSGVTHGVLSDAIIQGCIDREMTRFIAAKGDLPEVQGELEVRYLFDTQPKGIDGKRSEPMVERGEALAKLQRVEKMIQGMNVLGNTVKKELPHRRNPFFFNCGEGARLSSDQGTAHAGKSGMPFLSILGRIHVFPTVNILEDADLKFGSIAEFSSINVSGILTGAYPVKAGMVKAGEIRGCNLESLGDIIVSLGITNAVIKTQGSIRARYIHNSTIEAFGDVIVDHEILDSTITISGRCCTQKSRIIASKVSAKGGVTACGVGSDVTEPCRISAGREDHLVMELEKIALAITPIQKEIDRLRSSAMDMAEEINRLFKRMVGLKRLHDAAKEEKEKIIQKIEKEKANGIDKDNPQDLIRLKDLDKKIISAINVLKNHNRQKRALETELIALVKDEERERPKLMAEVQQLERKRFALLTWSQKSTGFAEIAVKERIAQGTFVSGRFVSTIVKDPCQGVKILETSKAGAPEKYRLTLKKL